MQASCRRPFLTWQVNRGNQLIFAVIALTIRPRRQANAPWTKHIKMVLDTYFFYARHAHISVDHRRQHLLKPSIFLLMFVSAALIAQASLAQQTQSKSGDKLPGSTTSTKATTEPAAMDQELRKPASAAEAAKVIDLSTFPLLPNVIETHARSVTSLEDVVRLKSFDVGSEFAFQRRNLLERQWKELPNGEGQFTRSGFHLYVTVQLHDEPGKAVVKLQNDGNVNVSKLPVPSGAKFLETAYNVASFETTGNVMETRELVRALLMEQGWQPYGTRGDAMDMKQNAVLLTASVTSSRQPGLTRIAYWTNQMPAELPVPPNSESILYQSDDNRLELVALGSVDEITSYYKTALASSEWKATAEKPSHEVNSQQFVLTFRNPAKDMLRLGMSERKKERTRITLKYQSAAEINERDRKR